MKIFVVFKLQSWEIKNAYSLLTPEILATIDPNIIHAKKEVEDKLYTTAEFEQMRDSMV